VPSALSFNILSRSVFGSLITFLNCCASAVLDGSIPMVAFGLINISSSTPSTTSSGVPAKPLLNNFFKSPPDTKPTRPPSACLVLDILIFLIILSNAAVGSKPSSSSRINISSASFFNFTSSIKNVDSFIIVPALVSMSCIDFKILSASSSTLVAPVIPFRSVKGNSLNLFAPRAVFRLIVSSPDILIKSSKTLS